MMRWWRTESNSCHTRPRRTGLGNCSIKRQRFVFHSSFFWFFHFDPLESSDFWKSNKQTFVSNKHFHKQLIVWCTQYNMLLFIDLHRACGRLNCWKEPKKTILKTKKQNHSIFIQFSFNFRNSPFQDVNALQQICQMVVLPNIRLRDTDLELFEDNAIECFFF